MRILHTADWHVGRRLGRHDRTDEMRPPSTRSRRSPTESDVDLVLVSGDVFDRPRPRSRRSRSGSARCCGWPRAGPSSSSPGNHDSPELFDALAPLLRRSAASTSDRARSAARCGRHPWTRRARRARGGRGRSRSCARGGSSTSCARPGSGTALYAEKVARDLPPRTTPRSSSARGRGPRPDAGRALHGERRPARPQRARAPHRRGVQRDRPGDPAGAAVRGARPHPRAAAGARRAGAGRVRGLAARRWTSARPARRSASCSSTSEPGRLATVRSVPLVSGRTAAASEAGTWDEIEARADELARQLPRSHGATSAAPIPSSAAAPPRRFPYLVRVRAERPGRRAHAARAGDRARPTTPRCTPRFHEARPTARTAPEAAARLVPRRPGGGRRCDRVS